MIQNPRKNPDCHQNLTPQLSAKFRQNPFISFGGIISQEMITYIRTDRQTQRHKHSATPLPGEWLIISRTGLGLETGKNPHCWGSVLFGFYQTYGFGSGSLQLRKIRVRFGFSSDVLCLRFSSMWVLKTFDSRF